MAKTQQMREWEQFVKRELEMMKREERLENVARIARANTYQQHKIMLRIEKDKEKAEKIAKDKAEIMQKRAAIRRRADEEKQEMMQKVQQMKKQGNFDKTELAALGIHVKSDNNESATDLTRDVGIFENTLNQDSMTQESKERSITTRSQLSFQQRSKSHMTDSERREIMESLQDRQKKEMNHLITKQKVQK